MDGEGCSKKDVPFLGEKKEKAKEFETPIKGRERIKHFLKAEGLHY
jgi:hypothetical protein